MQESHDNDEKVIGKIQESLDFLDSSVEVKKPDIMQLFDLVNTVEEKKAAKQNKQFITFLIVAVAAICLETFLFSRSVATFIITQILALICIIPLCLYIKKRNRQVSV